MSMNPPEPNDARCRSEPIEQAAEDERVPPVDARPRVSIAEALRNHWVEVWYQPKIDASANALPAPRRCCACTTRSLACWSRAVFTPRSTKPASSGLRKHRLVATLCDWTMFDEDGFNLHLAINVPVGVLLRMPVAALVADSSAIRALTGAHRRGHRDQVARDIALAKESSRSCAAAAFDRVDDFGPAIRRFRQLRDLPFAEPKSTAPLSATAPPTPPMPRSARPRSI